VGQSSVGFELRLASSIQLTFKLSLPASSAADSSSSVVCSSQFGLLLPELQQLFPTGASNQSLPLGSSRL